MATLSKPVITIIELPENPEMVRVKVVVDLTFTPADLELINCGMVVIAKCTLLHESKSPPDTPLFVFETQRPTASGTLVFKHKVAKDQLDLPGPDNIYARVKLRVPNIPPPVDSNVIDVHV